MEKVREPAYTCPLIDEVIAYLTELHSYSLELISALEGEKLAEGARNVLEDFTTEINSTFKPDMWGEALLTRKMEDIRKANSELREWGSHHEKQCVELEDVSLEVDGLKDNIYDLECKVRDLENENYSLEQENDRLKEDIDSLNQYIGELIERAVC